MENPLVNRSSDGFITAKHNDVAICIRISEIACIIPAETGSKYQIVSYSQRPIFVSKEGGEALITELGR